jgi:hypothetical protein
LKEIHQHKLEKETLEFETTIKKINEEKQTEKNKILKEMQDQQQRLEKEKNILHFHTQRNKINIF